MDWPLMLSRMLIVTMKTMRLKSLPPIKPRHCFIFRRHCETQASVGPAS